MGPRETAEAFSGHRFGEAYGQLHPDVRWVVPGHETMIGRTAVVAACEETAEHMAGLARTEFTRFVVVADDRVAAVYELDADGLVTTITSYAVELDE